jgi:ribosomal protein S18 acetylase RimI-like enzyme
MSRITVRAAGVDDAELIGRLDELCYGDPICAAVLQESVAHGCGGVFIAGWRGKPAGYAVFGHISQTAKLDRLGVRRSLRRKGIGTALARTVAELFEEGLATRCDAVVDETNLVAQLFLKRCGFRCWSTCPKDGGRYFFRLDKTPVDDPRRHFVSGRKRGPAERESQR